MGKGKRKNKNKVTKEEEEEFLKMETATPSRADEEAGAEEEMDGDEDEAGDVEGVQGQDDGDYGNFMKSLASLEGAPRFLHFNDERDVDVAFSEALRSDGDRATAVPIDSLLTDLPATKSGAAIRKALKRSVQGEEEQGGRKKRRKKRKGGEQEEEEEGQRGKKSSSLRLPAPLSAPEQERTARSALYERTKEDVGVWDAVVHSSRAADTKKFPLAKPDLRLATARDYSVGFRPRNALEEQVMSLLRKSKVAEESSKLSEKEEATLAQLSMREAEEKRKEMIRLRLLQQYQEAKLKRQNRIKSRKYRKLARKQKEKERQKEIEQLRKTDPEKALELMREDEKTRILERATLRHRNNSKFMQLQARRAKNDKESQGRLTETLSLHRSLTAKDPREENEEEEPETNEVEEGAHEEEKEEGEDSVSAFNAKFKKFWKEQSEAKEKARRLKEELKLRKDRERLEVASTSIEDLFSEARRVIKSRLDKAGENEEEEEEEGDDEEEVERKEEDESLAMKTDSDVRNGGHKNAADEAEKEKARKERAILDPDKFVQTVDLSKKRLPKMREVGGDNDDEEEEEEEGAEDFDTQAQAISEAFAGDDVTSEFKSEKQSQLEKERAKDVDLTLPGWGSWGGEGIKVSRRKRRRFTVRAPPPPRRRDDNRGHLIINEKEDEGLRKHQVSSVPFPFTTVSDFEASVRTPIGDTFVPRTAFKRLIKPKVETKMGTVIEPMTEEELVKRKIV